MKMMFMLLLANGNGFYIISRWLAFALYYPLFVYLCICRWMRKFRMLCCLSAVNFNCLSKRFHSAECAWGWRAVVNEEVLWPRSVESTIHEEWEWSHSKKVYCQETDIINWTMGWMMYRWWYRLHIAASIISDSSLCLNCALPLTWMWRECSLSNLSCE